MTKHIYIAEYNSGNYSDNDLRDFLFDAPIILERSTGRGDFEKIVNSEYNNFCNLYDDIIMLGRVDIDTFSAYLLSPRKYNFKNFIEVVEDYFSIKCSYGQALKVKRLCLAFEYPKSHVWVKEMLSALTQKKWELRQITGYCQGDCGYCYYMASNEFNNDFWEYLEAALFGGLNELHIWECSERVLDLDELDATCDDEYFEYTTKKIKYNRNEIIEQYAKENSVVHFVKPVGKWSYVEC